MRTESNIIKYFYKQHITSLVFTRNLFNRKRAYLTLKKINGKNEKPILSNYYDLIVCYFTRSDSLRNKLQ